VVQSESLLSIRLGLQSTLLKLGYVPQAHQTDHTTAATHKLGLADREKSPQERGYPTKERGYNVEYLQVLAHYGLETRTIHIASPNENGDVESSNGGLKRAVEQHLLLRGSRDFESLAVYETFLFGLMDKRNAPRQTKLAEELVVMKPLPAKPWPQMRELIVRVGQNGILRVGSNGYSVPSGLKGKRATVRIYRLRLADRSLVRQPAPRNPAARPRCPPLPGQLPSRHRQPAAQARRLPQLPLPRRPFPAGSLPASLGSHQRTITAP